MRRKLAALFTVALAMLLSVVLATPASAADFQPTSKVPPEVKYKYGYDYYSKEWLPDTDPNSPTYRKLKAQAPKAQPVSGNVHPAAKYYLDKQKQRQERLASPSSKPLVGKIIEPGKTPVKIPSTYKRMPIPGQAISSKIFGAAGLGIGGTAPAPTNTKELFLAQGGSPGCDINTMAGCTSTDVDKLMGINGCGIIGNCSTIGAKGAEGGDTDFFNQEVVPFFQDLWAKLTGQKDKIEMNADGHYSYEWGCNKKFIGFELTGPTTGTVHMDVGKQYTRPSSVYNGNQWDMDCKVPTINNATNFGLGSRVKTQCLKDGKTTDSQGNLGIDLGTSQVFEGGPSANNLTPLCVRSATLFRLTIVYTANNWGVATEYQTHDYLEYINPDPNMTVEEDLTTTTTVNCKHPGNGKTYTYSTTVKATGGFRDPQCPEGSEMLSHEVKASTPNGPTYNVDKGSQDATEAAKYPDCKTSGCAVEVWIDGKPCVVGSADCENWPAIAAKTPSRVQCKWGSYTSPTSSCNVISNGYKTETGVVYDPISDHFPAVDGNGEPTASNPEPWNPTNPTPQPGQPVGTAPSSGTNTGTPTSGTQPDDGCQKPAWSWNPTDWVKSPVACALKDAFVPKTDIKVRADKLATDFSGTVPISWMDQPIVGPTGGGTCPDWNVIIPNVLEKNVVCDSSFTQAILSVRLPLFGIVSAAMVWPLLRSIWYACIPVLRVTPSGGSK